MYLTCKILYCLLSYNSYFFLIREVFNKISAEDMEFAHDQDSDFEIPMFGNATSDYNEVVSLNSHTNKYI